MASHSEPNLLQGQGASRLWRCVALCIVAFAALTPLKLRAANAPIGLWIAPDIPPEFQIAVDRLIKQGDFAAATQGEAKVKIVSGRPGDGPSAQWIYVPVAAFPTTIDNIAWPNIQRYWQGDATALAAISGSNTKIESPVFITTPTILAYLTGLLGAPDRQIHVETVAPDALAMTLWRHRPAAWAIIPFDRLDPTMKALTLDGKSAFDRSLDLTAYPLVQTITLNGDTDSFKTTVAALQAAGTWPTTNRDLSKMTTVIMTGTVGMVRATAFRMENKGITYPAQAIAPFMADADFVHVSNTAPFATDCPFPNPTYIDTTKIHFCSRDSYLDLLKAIHVNVVELSANHVEDWGPDALNHTLDVYNANQIGYFGGGRDAQDARKALIVTHNGNTIAFIGCNFIGPKPVWATDNRPGAAKCDEDFLSKEIPRLKTIANIVVMTLEYTQYYQYDAPKDQVEYFQKFADLGADVVSGSGGHWPQAFAFSGSTFIHYGLGNLIFDQMDSLGERQLFADKYIIYNGKHISTVLFTGVLEDYSRPRPMTADERLTLLQTVFKASGW